MRIIAGIVIGGLFGFGWYKLVGCKTGSCTLTRNPWLSVLYGALIGLMFGLNV